MSVTIEPTTEPELVDERTFVQEVRHFAGTIDRPTAIFWSTQILCWLLVVAVAMVWGLGSH